MNINVHIERLILDGVPIAPSEGRVLQAAVEAEVSRLLGEGGLAAALQSGGALPLVKGHSIQLASDSNPTQLGQQIAQAVYSGIGR